MFRAHVRPRWAVLSLLQMLFLSGLASAQTGPAVVMSLSGNGSLPDGTTVEDEELLRVDASGMPRRFLNDQTLAFYLGDGDGDGVLDEPNDIDALEIITTGPGEPVAAGIYFSLVSDQFGYRDGDILRFDPSGTQGPIETAFDEAGLAAALGIDDGNLDVDALTFSADGSLLFSVAEDETTGGGVGLISDEDVLILPPGSSTASILVSAVQVEQWVRTALGLAVVIGDLKSLCEHDGHLLFTVQAPSSDDATVFSSEGMGTIYSGMSESLLGFTNAVEADALALYDGEAFPDIDLDAATGREGDLRQLAISGLTPSQPFLLLASHTAMPAGSGLLFDGFGVLAMDPTDPLYIAGLLSPAQRIGVSDANGMALYSGILPVMGGAIYAVALQVVDGASRSISNPVLLQVNR